MIKFYDTCSLLELQQKVFNSTEKFLISNITLKELESIKTSGTKDEETKWAARQFLHLLDENKDAYEIIIYKNIYNSKLEEYDLPLTNDSQIIISAKIAFEQKQCSDTGIFITQDLACKALAESVGLTTNYLSISKDNYNGFKEIHLNEEQLAEFYNNFLVNNINECDLLTNEYLLIYLYNDLVDKYKWVENHYVKIPFYKTQSKMFGKISPKENDVYQQIALDSLFSNKITLLRGRAGSGKTLLSFGYMFDLLEKSKIDKIIIFCNTVATKGSAKLGFYPGSRTEKLLDSQIGNLLESKLGDRIAVEQLIDDGHLVLLPMSDIRGYDTSGMNAAVYISEAQNLDIELMRLALQRLGDDSICILDGDYAHQVDMSIYAGSHNGMRRVSEVFRGQPFYGEIELQNIYRSDIAKIAELM